MGNTTKDDVSVNRNYKDNLFCFLFGRSKENALSLYNAVNGTNYTNADDLEFQTLEDVIFIKMKNDVAFLFGHELCLYEHQSTYNPNMPLRGLMYAANEYRKLLHNKRLEYRSTLVKIPVPRYYVFYNGEDKQPEKKELKLSEAFEIPDKSGKYEWTATMLNINYGENAEMMNHCRILQDYSRLVYEVNKRRKVYKDFKTAIIEAVDYCIDNDILKDFLMVHKSEVLDMLLTEYDEKLHSETLRQEGFEEGLKEGLKDKERYMSLMKRLLKEGRYDEAEKISDDIELQKKLMVELGI